MNIVLLGFPGAGKGTQAEKLVEKYDFRHISTGDLIRQEIALGTPLGKEVEATIDSGNLASDELIINILVNAIKDEKRGLIFDGFPRTIAQAEALDGYLTRRGARVKCGKCGGALYIRHDDDERSARHRLEVFHKETRPLIEYYERGGKCKAVDGSGSIGSVFKEIEAVLGLSKDEEK